MRSPRALLLIAAAGFVMAVHYTWQPLLYARFGPPPESVLGTVHAAFRYASLICLLIFVPLTGLTGCWRLRHHTRARPPTAETRSVNRIVSRWRVVVVRVARQVCGNGEWVCLVAGGALALDPRPNVNGKSGVLATLVLIAPVYLGMFTLLVHRKTMTRRQRRRRGLILAGCVTGLAGC